MQASKALLLSAMLSSSESVENAEIATFDASCVSTPDIVVQLEPIQDLHGYDNPWPAGGGSNKWDEETTLGYFTSTGEWNNATSNLSSKNPILVEPGQVFYIICQTAAVYVTSFTEAVPSGASASDKFIARTYVQQNGGIYTVPTDCHAIHFNIGAAYGTTYNHDVAVNYPSSATSYAPYSNICPISGRSEVSVTRTGANVYDEQYESGYYDTADGSAKSSSNWARSKNPIPCKPQTQYCFVYNGTSTESMGYMLFYKADGTYINAYTQLVLSSALNGQVFTTPENAEIIKFYSKPSHFSGNISINHPSTIHTYNPYQAQTVTIQLGQTVYGGTVDVTSGKMTITHGYAEGVYVCIGPYRNTYGIWVASFLKSGVNAGSNKKAPICNILRTFNDKVYETLESDGIVRAENASNIGIIGLTDSTSGLSSSSTTQEVVSTLANYLNSNNATFCYELATPVEVTLTPVQIQTLVGENNIWSDAGNVSVLNITCNADFLETYLMMKMIGEC